jgi:hypothetical protein
MNLLKLKPYLSGLGLIVVSIAAYLITQGNPINDFQLMSSGVTVPGSIIEVNDFEDREDNGNLSRYFFIKYEFTTGEGGKISDVVEVPGRSSDRGFQTGQSLDIQYLAGTPNIHRIKALASTSTTEWLLKNLLFLLLAIVPGSYMIYRSYQAERKSRVTQGK